MESEEKRLGLRVVAAASVHLFTALGSVCALLAVVATVEGAYERAFAWLFVALVVDAVDGTMARAVGVTEHLPRFSGERLDLVIDYVTYVFVPVLALLHGKVLTGWVGNSLAALVLVSALYHFSDTESKAADNCFVGFPVVWNLVAFCLFAWALPGWAASAIVAALVCLTFVPMRWVHPMRVKRHFALNMAVTAAGLGSGLWILWRGLPAGVFPGSVLAVCAAYFVVMAMVWRVDVGG